MVRTGSGSSLGAERIMAWCRVGQGYGHKTGFKRCEGSNMAWGRCGAIDQDLGDAVGKSESGGTGASTQAWR